ncbi:DMT family transporter [Candidatus Cryosericum terrychapinii]|uniref:DMT family transporter n=1 Tax=Candidatus Cryosericum terrychapinii TaxID=2290919 RepID=UPI001401F99D|nr:DMT family transporter [Candidatus Cryosericum terrychapinii]
MTILYGMRAAARQKSGGRPDIRAWAGLILAVLGVSGTSTYMKLAGTDPLVTAFWRLALSTLLLLPLQVWRRRNTLARNGPVPKCNTVTETEPPKPFCSRRGVVVSRSVTMLAGAFLAVHFALWVTSLSMTSVLSSLVFVTMTPLFVAVLDLVLFRGRTSPLLWVAVGVVTAGGVFIGLRSGTGANLGNLLALGGALASSLYLIVGRRASREMDPVSYNVGTFGWAAVLTGVVCVVAGRPLLALSGTSFLWLAVTAVLGQTVGHGLINASLKSFQPQFVALMLLWEPILGSLLAFLVLGDRPGPAELVGGAIILAGLAVGIVVSRRSAAEGPGGAEGQPL